MIRLDLDVHEFMAEIEALPFAEAVKRLRELLQHKQDTPASVVQFARRVRLHDRLIVWLLAHKKELGIGE